MDQIQNMLTTNDTNKHEQDFPETGLARLQNLSHAESPGAMCTTL